MLKGDEREEGMEVGGKWVKRGSKEGVQSAFRLELKQSTTKHTHTPYHGTLYILEILIQTILVRIK
jgi:hypothetical protein